VTTHGRLPRLHSARQAFRLRWLARPRPQLTFEGLCARVGDRERRSRSARLIERYLFAGGRDYEGGRASGHRSASRAEGYGLCVRNARNPADAKSHGIE
jgi:hypothetical protein